MSHPHPDTRGDVGLLEDRRELMNRTLHSSRNLVMSVRGWAELIQSEVGAGDQHGEWAGKIVRQVDRLTELYQRVEMLWDDDASEVGSHALGRTLTEALRRLDGHEGRERLRTELDAAVAGRSEPGELVEAVQTLLQNALEASPAGSVVRLELRSHGTDGWEIEIEDEGDGMTAEVLERAGEAFFSRKAGHLGLGLFRCRNILKRHGLELSLLSAPGEGTRARIRRNEDPRGVDR